MFWYLFLFFLNIQQLAEELGYCMCLLPSWLWIKVELGGERGNTRQAVDVFVRRRLAARLRLLQLPRHTRQSYHALSHGFNLKYLPYRHTRGSSTGSSSRRRQDNLPRCTLHLTGSRLGLNPRCLQTCLVSLCSLRLWTARRQDAQYL